MKSGKSRRGSSTLRALLLGSVALGLALPAQAGETTLEDLERQMQQLIKEMQTLKRQQRQQQQQIEAQKNKIETQEDQIEAQQEQITAQQEQVTPAPAQAVTAGDQPGSFKLPGTDTSMKISGYVKADLWYDVNEDVSNSFNATSIPRDDGTPTEEGSFRAQARQSRMRVESWTPSPLGVVQTKIEGDFLGSTGNELFSNSTSFRLRHAYGTVIGENWDVLFGQTWTNFMPLASYPDTVDFFGPTGLPFIRQGQGRVTYKGIENFKISFSAENSELNARDTAGNSISSESALDLNFGVDTIPDFTGALEYDKDGWNFKLAGVGRLLETETNPAGDDDETAWGIFAGGVIPTFGDDSLQVNLMYGDGVGRYTINGFLQDAVIDATTGAIDTVELWGAALAYTHHWTPNLRSNLVYGHTELEDTFGPTDFESLDTVHVNTWWAPADNYRFGIEWIYGAAGFENGSLDNEANRIQFGGQYFF